MKVAEVMIDGCKFLGSFYNNFIYGKLFKRIQNHSNLPTKCPLPPVSMQFPSSRTSSGWPKSSTLLQNKLYAIRNYSLVADEYPLGTPALKYTMGLTFYRSNNTVAHVRLDGAVIYKERE